MKRFIVGFIPLSFMVGLPAIAGRMACVLTAALLLCASSAHGQVIEEGGFPVKGGGVSGEPFSLSCPPRLYVAAGESVLFSCSATAVPEEGVRYEWESLSGDGLHLLSASDELSPLFTAPLSGESVEYVYRLTAMSVGVYETATVTVSVEVVSGETVSAPVVQEECDSFGGFGRDREGCHPWEKAPWPDSFGGLPEDEGIVPWPSFPESPGAEEKEFAGSSGAGPFPQTPPYLDCPVAVFLEELETGAIECHVSDASGEEFLEYSWEPVGSTTRDYMDNPRLIPEDAPNPSVVAPEAPVYETLESFHSGETTFRYRYRLTATSRATGLSSSSEVEVFVSSSRPSVYCPLEVVVEEGSTAQLDCEGADPLSHRMDYDEEEASVLWEWEGLWGTSTAHLDATDMSSPLFMAPVGSAGEEYHYIASMTSSASGMPRTARRRVKVTVREAGEEAGISAIAESDGTAPARNGSVSGLQLICKNGTYRPLADLYYYGVDDTESDFVLDCEATGGPAGATYTYSWAATEQLHFFYLSATDIPNPTFRVPSIPIRQNATYVYQLRVEATDGSTTVRARVKLVVDVVDKLFILYSYIGNIDKDEGAANFQMDIIVVGDTSGLIHTWSGSPEALELLSEHDILTPWFDVPDNVDEDTEYDYVFNSTGLTEETFITVTVRDTDVPTPVITCQDANLLGDHGAYVLDCSVTDEPSGATYSWVGRGSTGNTARLIAGTDSLTPTFSAPDVIPSSPQDTEKTYEYTVMLEAEGIDDITADVTITVEHYKVICWISETSMLPDHIIHTVNEGASDYAFRTCEGGITSPGGPPYTYEWTYSGPLGSAAELLTATAQPSVSFKVPGNLPHDQDYRFHFKVFRASDDENVDETEFIITVKNLDPVACNDPPDYVYEGSTPFALDCTDTGALSGVTWVWDPTDHLTNTGAVAPTFTPPEIDEETQDFPYTVTAMVGGADMGGSNVTVRVLRKARLYVGCPNRGFYGAYEGEYAFIMLDCEANGAGDGSNYDFEWTPRGSTTNTDRLTPSQNTGTRSQPKFAVPDSVNSDETYEYTLTARRVNAVEGVHDVTVTVWNKPDIDIDCPGNPYSEYEGEGNIVLACSATGAPEGSTHDYTWTARGTTSNTNKLIAGTNGPTPTFDVPEEVNSDETYEYTLTVSAKNAEDDAFDITVEVLKKVPLTLVCSSPLPVYEGAEDFDLDCVASGAPQDSEYDYVWTGRGSTVVPGRLSSTTIAKPTFDVPGSVNADTDYEYTLTVSARGADTETANVTVRVLNTPSLALVCTPVAPVYEGAEDFDLDCVASGAPQGSEYDYVWTGRGSTVVPGRLSSTTIAKPTFDVPGSVNSNEIYEYTLTASAENAGNATANVTVRVLNTPSLTLVCTPPAPVYEGAEDFDLDCVASGAPQGSEYDYVWTGRGSTVVPGRLSSTTIAKPTFDVPGSVNSNEIYEYTLTASAENAGNASANVTVRVLNKEPLALICTPVAPVYEGSEDFDLDCSASGAPQGSEYDYVWTPRGSTVVPGRLSSTTIAKPTFDVPGSVNADTDYEYTLTVSARGADTETANVTVRVLNTPPLALICTPVAPVYEGAEDFDLDCVASGAPQGSEYDYVWTGRGSTVVPGRLSSTTIAKPTFDVPGSVNSNETYEYTLTASAENAGNATANVTVRVLNKAPLALICTPVAPVYEGAADFDLDCVASGAPQGSEYNYVWTGRGSTVVPGRLSSTTIAKPTFDVPGSVNSNDIYEYTLTASAENAEDASANVTVRVLNKAPLALICTPVAPVYEGSEDFDLDCSASGAPQGSEYDYVWTARGATPNTDKLIAGTDGPTPTFDVPEEVAEDETYRYTLTASAENAGNATANVTVRVLNTPSLTLVCTPPAPVYEGSADFALNCSASGAPSGSTYVFEWTARGGGDTGKLSSTTIEKPTFDVPGSVNSNEIYEYTLTASAENAEDASANVTVRVLNKVPLALICTPVAPVYEGSEDFDLDCVATGAPAGSDYAYVWTGRGTTSNTALLVSGTDGPTPTFDVPDEVAEDETYRYTLTASAENAEDASANVTVRVLNKEPLALICTPPTPVYEGSADFALDCSASGAPSGSDYVFEWTARGSGDTGKLSSTTIAKPTFDVPEEVDRDETYEYTLTVSADHAESATEDVTVTVLNKEALAVVCATPSPVYEGSEDFALDCAATGAPAGSDYTYVWTGRGTTSNTDLLVSGTNGPTPTFDVPDEVDEDKTYEYLLTVSAENAIDATAEVTVTVLKLGSIALICASPPLVYEGSEDFALDCSVSGDTGDTDYTYEWTARGAPENTDLLIAGTDGPTPTFAVPDALDETTTYEYFLTARAENVEDATAAVTVTVLNRGTLDVACTPPPLVYEGSADFALDCTASGAPVGSDYEYVWTARGSTSNTDLLIAGTDGPTPTFYVPDALDETTTYEYLLTASAENAESSSARVTVTVLNRGALSVVCVDPPSVYEGSENFDLDCSASGAPAGSEYAYVWTARGSTSDTALLISGTDGPTPTFAVPDQLEATTTYEYLLTVSAENAESASAAVTVTVLNRGALSVVCVDPPSVYEGSENFDLDCSASGAPAGSEYAYVWTARGSTSDTALLISGTDGPTPTFAVPDQLEATTTYEYLLTASAENAEDATAEVTVTVLNRGTLDVACAPPPSVYEGSEDFDLDCSASGAPAGSEYTYAWTARGGTANTDLLIAGTDGPTPTFAVPDELDATTTYEYLLTASAENVEDATAEVTVTVLNRGALSVVCADPPSVYEGSEDIMLDCSASGAPAGSEYAYVWTARGATPNTDLLIAGTDGPTPTFAVPDALDATTTYEYLLTASAENAESGSAAVTVTVLNAGALRVVCADPPSVYEGSADFDLDCSASGAPVGSEYAYVWTARGATSNTDLLIAGTDSPTPTFDVPDALDETTTYEYLLTVSAENAESASAAVTVTVLNRGALSVVCVDPPSVYEGSENFDLDCSASGAPAGSEYAYVWTARGSTSDTALLISGTDGPTPTFAVPDQLEATTTYEYLLTASAENAEDATAEVTVTVLNRGTLDVACAPPPSVYEGSEDFDLDCSASGAPAGSEYTYAWTARGGTANTDLLIAGTDGPTPTFAVPEELDATTTYEYLLTASADNVEDATAEVTVTVLNRGALSVVCADPPSIYEGSEDFSFDCSASGASGGSDYTYVWTARGSTANTDQLSAADISSPTFYVPEELDATTTYEYLLTASADNVEDATAEVTVTVLNRGPLSVVCADPPSIYEGSEDFSFDCSASGAPAGSGYTYVWAARGTTANTDLLTSGTDGPTPTFSVPDEVDEDETYEYMLTVSAENAESASAEVTVNVLGLPLAFVDDSIAGRVYIFTVGEVITDILLPEATGGLFPYTHILTPLLPRGLGFTIAGDPTWTISGTPLEASPRAEYAWQVTDANAETVQITFFIEVVPAPEPPPPVAESSELPEPSSLGVTVSASSLRFGVQSAETQVSLDPMADQISTYVSGPYHAGRVTLSLDGSEALDENGEMDLSIELASPVTLRREGGIEAASIVLSPSWSLAESCEQLSSQAVGGLYTEVTLSEDACRLLRFGGELDLADVPSGRYTGSMDIILRSGESEETHSVEVDVTVIPAQRVITIGPGGVRFSTSRELPAGLTEEQNLSIYPHVAFLTDEKLHGVFELSNPSLVPLEVTVSARFGYTEATENGREVVVEDASGSHLGDLSQVVDIHPGVVVLQPGEKGLVRYGVKEGVLSDMDERGYAAFFDVVSEPRQYVRSDQMPEEVSGEKTARVTMRVPGVYVPGEGASQLRAALLSISYVGSLSATFLLETQDHPFVGEVLAYDGEGRELGRRETLVYTRSRVRIPLDRVPEGGAVFLRFAPRGSDRVPLPASVEWDAPRRDIGAADKDRTRPPQTLVQRP